jgi:DNA-3-methyladenine glycosylase
VEVAPDLLGLVLVHNTKAGITKGRIVEAEAYMGNIDPAAHSYNNRSSRTEIQFGEGGYAYIYMIYGMHYCMNIVTNVIQKSEAILLRALEPVEGIKLMEHRRKTDKRLNLCSGPGKLCTAMGITKENYGMDLCGEQLYLEHPETIETFDIIASRRINIDYAGEAKDYLWRYTVKGSKYISAKIK